MNQNSKLPERITELQHAKNELHRKTDRIHHLLPPKFLLQLAEFDLKMDQLINQAITGKYSPRSFGS